MADLTKFSGDVLDPLRESKSQMGTMLESAYTLDQLAKENEDVLTSTGSTFSRAVDRVINEFDAIENLVKQGASEEEVQQQVAESVNLGQLGENATDAARFTSELTKFAFTYASSGLGQSGRGLSDQDFKNALRIVGSGSSYPTFSRNLRDITQGATSKLQRQIDGANEASMVNAYREINGKFSHLIDPDLKDADAYFSDVGLSEAYEWSQSQVPQQETQPDPVRNTDSGAGRAGAAQQTEQRSDLPPTNHLEHLRNNPTEDVIRQFNEAYGEGMAEMYLDAKGNQ